MSTTTIEAPRPPAGEDEIACSGCCDEGQDDAKPGPAAPVVALLRELAGVVEGLSDEQYITKPVGVIPGSVGGHVRHCLDHVWALLSAPDSGHLDYGHRERGTDIERSRPAALAAMAGWADRLAALPEEATERPLRVRPLMTADGGPLDVPSGVGRELGYVLSHTIHHNAILGAMVKTLGGRPPDRFGYAPATIRHTGPAGARARPS